MERNLRINVKYTLKDIKDFCFAKTLSKPFNKVFLILKGLVFILYIISIPVIILLPIQDKFFMLFMLFVSAIPIIIMIGAAVLPFILFYFSQTNNYKKSKLMEKFQCFELNDEAITIFSSDSSFTVKWNDIYQIQELKPCFLIFTSPGKSFLLPRRCFSDEGQLNEFVGLFTTKLQKSKLKFKRYKLGKISPDAGEIEIKKPSQEPIQQADQEKDTQLFNLSFSLFKKDIIEANFILYYTKPVGIIITVIGAAFILSFLASLLTHKNSSIMSLVFGIMFTLFVPIMMYTNTSKRFENDAALKKPYNYKFFKDYFVIDHPSGVVKIRWDELVKVTEIKTAYLLFASTQIAHIIPKSVIISDEEKHRILRELIKDKLTKQKTIRLGSNDIL